MNILWITDELPDPRTGGAPTIYYHLLRHVSAKHRVSLIAIVRSQAEFAEAEGLRSLCSRMELVLLEGRTGLRRVLRTLLAGEPPRNAGVWSEEMTARIKRVCAEEAIDIVQVEHAFMAPYVRCFPKGGRGPKKLLVFHNIGPAWYRRMYQVETIRRRKIEFWLDWILSLWWEKRICREFDALVTLSPEDRVLLSRELQPRCHVVRHGIDTEGLRPLPRDPACRELLMVGGMSYAPNRDAVLFFRREIFPRIREKLPSVRLTIVGDDPPDGLNQGLPTGTICTTGFVDSVVPYYERAAMLIVPLRAGGGVRGKILEAMALGRPVVSTTLGCEGMAVSPGENIMTADEPNDFADAVIRVLQDPSLQRRLVDAGRKYVEEHHAWRKVSDRLLMLYEMLVCGTPEKEDADRG